MSKFYIVQFNDGINVVPEAWILDGHDTNECYWPPTTLHVPYDDAVKKGIKPNDTWSLCQIEKNLGVYCNKDIIMFSTKNNHL